MKVINKICRFAASVFGLASLVLFFMPFANITNGGTQPERDNINVYWQTFVDTVRASGGNNASVVGAVLAFGSKVTVGGTEYTMAKSSDILFCLLLTAIAFILSIFSFKSKKLRYFAPAVGLVSTIYMLVIALSNPYKFVDKRPLPDVTGVTYSSFVLITAIALLVFTALASAYLFIDDYIEVAESKGEKLTIVKRVIRFFRDYKSEVKKIVWPGPRDVVKNTVIVLIMCVIVGAFIWLVDYGLGQLLKLILGA